MASNFSLRDTVRLEGIHPLLIEKLDRIFGKCAARGRRMFVVQGLRTTAQQQAEYAKGRTVPGKKVTMKDGIVHKSNHQAAPDGFGHAVDCAFAGEALPFADALPWEAFGLDVEAEGLTWGGRWAHPHDSPHAELPYTA